MYKIYHLIYLICLLYVPNYTPGLPLQSVDRTRSACLITFCIGNHIRLVDLSLGVDIRQPSTHSHPRVGVLRFLLCNPHRRISGVRLALLCGSVQADDHLGMCALHYSPGQYDHYSVGSIDST